MTLADLWRKKYSLHLPLFMEPHYIAQGLNIDHIFSVNMLKKLFFSSVLLCLIFILSFCVYFQCCYTLKCYDKAKIANIELQRLNQAIVEFWLDTGELPGQLNDLYHDTNHPMWMGPYVKERELKDPWGQSYRFNASINHMSYQLFTLGADQQYGGGDHATDQFISHRLKSQP